MRSTQTRFEENVQVSVEATLPEGWELVLDRQYANTGNWVVYNDESMEPVAKVHFQFNSTYASFSTPMLPHPGNSKGGWDHTPGSWDAAWEWVVETLTDPALQDA